MRSRNRELERLVDHLLAKFNAQLRMPLNEVSSFFEWLRGVRFRSDAVALEVIETLRAESSKLELKLYRQEDIATLRTALATLRRQIGELANKAPE